MRKILLTSAGFENIRIKEAFLQLAEKEPSKIKALWIPVAAVSEEAKTRLPKCWGDLINAGIPAENISIYDCDREMPYEELKEFDVVYFCGGSPKHLVKKIHESKFDRPLCRFIENGGIYVGVSAGSMVAAENLADGLGFVNCVLAVHQEEGTPKGKINLADCPKLALTNQQAILIVDDRCEVIE